MKSFFIFFILIITSTLLAAQEKVLRTDSGKDIRFVVRNICNDYDQVILCNGNDSTNISPSIGNLLCLSPLTYVHYDSLLSINKVKYFDVDESGFSPYYSKLLGFGNDSILITYHLTYPNGGCDSLNISATDTIFSDSIAAINIENNQLIYIRSSGFSNNFFKHSPTLFSMHLNMIPLLLATSENGKSAIVGTNQNNETELIIINLANQQILKDTILFSQLVNPVGIYFNWNVLFIVSCPGDSMINLTTYDTGLDAFYTETIWTESGIHAFAFYSNGFIFQPETDTSFNGYDKQLITFSNHSNNFHNINKRLKMFYYPEANLFGYLNPLVAIEDLPQTNKLLLYDSFQLNDSILTDINPAFFSSDFRCPTKVAEYDDSKIEWQLFPNPSENEFFLVASGLICGREYKVDIIDIAGHLKYETTVHAKMIVNLPAGDFPPGVYFVRIHSKKGMVVQKVVKI